MDTNELEQGFGNQNVEPLSTFTFRVNGKSFITHSELASIGVHSRFHFPLYVYIPVILTITPSHESLPVHRRPIGNSVPLAGVWGGCVSDPLIPVKNFFVQRRKDAKFFRKTTKGHARGNEFRQKLRCHFGAQRASALDSAKQPATASAALRAKVQSDSFVKLRSCTPKSLPLFSPRFPHDLTSNAEMPRQWAVNFRWIHRLKKPQSPSCPSPDLHPTILGDFPAGDPYT